MSNLKRFKANMSVMNNDFRIFRKLLELVDNESYIVDYEEDENDSSREEVTLIVRENSHIEDLDIFGFIIDNCGFEEV